MSYGLVQGVPRGSVFSDRRSLYHANIHRHTTAIICGGLDSRLGAESVLLGPQSVDERAGGNWAYVTGVGRRDEYGNPAGDQEFTGLNGALECNVISRQPVRFVQQTEAGYEYRGLAVVEDAFMRRSISGYQICQFRILILEDGSLLFEDESVGAPQRVMSTHYRLVRDAGVPARVKALYDYRCQVCNLRIETLAGPYSEGAHLVPLGGSPSGPDIDANVLSLCPNHHVMLDHGGLFFADDWSAWGANGSCIGALSVHPLHGLDNRFAREHRRLMGF